MRISDWSSDVCSSDLNAKTYGLEFEGTLIPWKGMTIEGSAAYLHARYEKGSRFENQLVGGELVEVDRSGEPITQAPKWTASIGATQERSEEHTSELQSLMRISYAVFCLQKKIKRTI